MSIITYCPFFRTVFSYFINKIRAGGTDMKKYKVLMIIIASGNISLCLNHDTLAVYLFLSGLIIHLIMAERVNWGIASLLILVGIIIYPRAQGDDFGELIGGFLSIVALGFLLEALIGDIKTYLQNRKAPQAFPSSLKGRLIKHHDNL